VKNAVAKGARLFYFVALVGPAFILEKRQQKQAAVDCLKHAKKALEAEQQQMHRQESITHSTREFDAQTQNLLAGLEERMRPQVFRTWFKDAFLVSVAEDSLTLAAPSPGAAEWIAQRYTALIQEVSGKASIRVIAAS
jgi:hypothetical protein